MLQKRSLFILLVTPVSLLLVVILLSLGVPESLEMVEVAALLNHTAGTIEVEVNISGEPIQTRLAGFGLIPGSGGFTTELERDLSCDLWRPRLFDPWTKLGGIEAKAYNEILVGAQGKDGSWLLSRPRSVVSSYLSRESFHGSVDVTFNGSGVSVAAVGMDPCKEVGVEVFLVGPMGLVAGGGTSRPGSDAFFKWPDEIIGQRDQVGLSDLVLLTYGHAWAEDNRFLVVGPIVEYLGNPPRIAWEEYPEPVVRSYRIG